MKELDEIKVESNQQTIAWENRKKLGQIIGWLITWKNIIFSPSHFFKKLNPDGKITDAFLFAILTHLFCLAIVFIRPLQNTSNRSVLTFIGLYTFRFIILAIALLFIRSVVFNLASKFAGGKYGYRTTFRICGYVEAISLLIIAVSFIPIAKLRYVVKTALIIYGIVLYFIAFKKVQHIKSFKAFFALLSAMILVAILNIVLETSIVAYGIHRGFSSVINKNNKITEEVNEKKQAPKSDKNLFSTKADEQFGRFAKKDEIVGFWKLIPLPDEISEKINRINPYPSPYQWFGIYNNGRMYIYMSSRESKLSAEELEQIFKALPDSLLYEFKNGGMLIKWPDTDHSELWGVNLMTKKGKIGGLDVEVGDLIMSLHGKREDGKDGPVYYRHLRRIKASSKNKSTASSSYKGNVKIAGTSEFIQKDSNSGVVYYKQAIGYIKKKEYGKAWKAVRKAQLFGYEVDDKFLNLLKKSSLPMFGNVERTPKEKERDAEFISGIVNVGTKEEGAEKILQDGWAKLKKGDVRSAIKRFNAAWLLTPNNEKVFLGFGDALRKWDLTVEAIDMYSKSIELNPNYADAYYSRGFTYFKKMEFERSLEDIKRAKELGYKIPPNILDTLNTASRIEYSKNEKTYYLLALNFYSNGDDRKAISYLDTAVGLNPSYEDAYFLRGSVYLNISENEQAISDFTKVIEINPGYARAYLSRGISYSYLMKYDLAILDYTNALEIKPGYAEAYNNRALIYFLKKEYDKARDDARKAQELGYEVLPEFIELLGDVSWEKSTQESKGNLLKEGIRYLKAGEYDKAIVKFSNSLELNPLDDKVYYNRGLAYYKKGKYEKCISDFSKAIILNPYFAEACYMKGLGYQKKGNFKKAIYYAKKAIQIKPEYPEAYYFKGVAYLHNGEYGKAWRDINKAKDLGFDIPENLFERLKKLITSEYLKRSPIL